MSGPDPNYFSVAVIATLLMTIAFLLLRHRKVRLNRALNATAILATIAGFASAVDQIKDTARQTARMQQNNQELARVVRRLDMQQEASSGFFVVSDVFTDMAIACRRPDSPGYQAARDLAVRLANADTCNLRLGNPCEILKNVERSARYFALLPEQAVRFRDNCEVERVLRAVDIGRGEVIDVINRGAALQMPDRLFRLEERMSRLAGLAEATPPAPEEAIQPQPLYWIWLLILALAVEVSNVGSRWLLTASWSVDEWRARRTGKIADDLLGHGNTHAAAAAGNGPYKTTAFGSR